MGTYTIKSPEKTRITITKAHVDNVDDPRVPIIRWSAQDQETGRTVTAETEREAYSKLTYLMSYDDFLRKVVGLTT